MSLAQPAPVTESPLHLHDLPRPQPGHGELLLHVSACAVCRTDLQLAEGDIAARRLPVVPGHQIIGTVEQIGPGAEGWLIGDSAGIGWLAGACGGCGFCLSNRENLCAQASFTGWDRDGGFAEYATVRADYALRFPESLSAADAAPLLCGGVIGYRALLRSGIQRGGRLGLYGYGASARLAIQVALHWGCEVYVCTRSSEEQAQALSAGAAWAGGYDDAPPKLLDAAVTFAPSGDVVIAALRALERGGIVAINAIHLDRIPQFSYDLLWPERELRSVANYTRRDAEEFLALAAEIPIVTSKEVLPLDNANLALQRLAAGGQTRTAVLVPG